MCAVTVLEEQLFPFGDVSTRLKDDLCKPVALGADDVCLTVGHLSEAVVYEFHPAPDELGVDIKGVVEVVEVITVQNVCHLAPSFTLCF
jgi:hypothetical protein